MRKDKFGIVPLNNAPWLKLVEKAREQSAAEKSVAVTAKPLFVRIIARLAFWRKSE